MNKEQQIQTEVSQVLQLRTQFYKEIGLPEDVRRQHYEPVVARAGFERRVLSLTGEDRIRAQENFQSEESTNLRKALRERYNTKDNVFEYQLLNGELYSPFFPDEPFTDVIERGIVYCREIRKEKPEIPDEGKREKAEKQGFIKLQQAVKNEANPVGTKIVMFSPPGMMEGTMYPFKFIDIWEIKVNGNGQRFAEQTRFTTTADHDGYKKLAKGIRPEYFNEWYKHNEQAEDKDIIPLDAWFLDYPINMGIDSGKQSKDALFDSLFEHDPDAMKEDLIQEALYVCWPLVKNYLDELCQDKRDFPALAGSFHAILARADAFLKDRERFGQARSAQVVLHEITRSGIDIKQQAIYWSAKPVETRLTDCGESKGFGNNLPEAPKLTTQFEQWVNAFSNSTVQALLKDMFSANSEGFDCPNCGHEGTKGEECKACHMTRKRWGELHEDKKCA